MNYYPLDKIDQHHDQPCWCEECAEVQRVFDAEDLANEVKLEYDNTKRMEEYWANKESDSCLIR